METENAITVRQNFDIMEGALTPAKVIDQIQLIQQVMEKSMKDGVHYGIIPGTEKPTLLQPGAEKLCFVFRLDPQQENRTINLSGEHREEKVLTRLIHIPTGVEVGQGWGSCSTMESKYRWRLANIKCPACGKETVIKGKEDFGGGWVCWQKKGGCGATFADDDKTITEQPRGRVENPDIADLYNTVLKIACKRSLISAIRAATAASDIYHQDLDEEHIRRACGIDESKTMAQGEAKDKPKTGASTKAESPAETLGRYRKAARARGKTAEKELEMVLTAYCSDVVGKDLSDCNEAEQAALIEYINAHYQSKKEKK